MRQVSPCTDQILYVLFLLVHLSQLCYRRIARKVLRLVHPAGTAGGQRSNLHLMLSLSTQPTIALPMPLPQPLSTLGKGAGSGLPATAKSFGRDCLRPHLVTVYVAVHAC